MSALQDTIRNYLLIQNKVDELNEQLKKPKADLKNLKKQLIESFKNSQIVSQQVTEDKALKLTVTRKKKPLTASKQIALVEKVLTEEDSDGETLVAKIKSRLEASVEYTETESFSFIDLGNDEDDEENEADEE